MASNQADQETQLQKEAGQASDGGQSPPSGHPPAGAGYQPAIGYPPPMGYPPGQPGYPPPGYYQGHPHNGYSTYPYAQAPPAAWHNSQMHHPSQPQSYKNSAFHRGVLVGIVLIILTLCTTSIVMWVILRPEIPVFKVATLSVSNFKATSPGFTANWMANVTVQNPNTKLTVYFDKIQNFMFYDEDSLATSFTQPFLMGTTTNNAIRANLSANGNDQAPVPSWVVDKMAKDRSSGAVSFNLRMVILTTFKSGTWWTRRVTMRVYCDGIKVSFVGAAGYGNSVPFPGGEECLVFA